MLTGLSGTLSACLDDAHRHLSHLQGHSTALGRLQCLGRRGRHIRVYLWVTATIPVRGGRVSSRVVGFCLPISILANGYTRVIVEVGETARHTRTTAGARWARVGETAWRTRTTAGFPVARMVERASTCWVAEGGRDGKMGEAACQCMPGWATHVLARSCDSAVGESGRLGDCATYNSVVGEDRHSPGIRFLVRVCGGRDVCMDVEKEPGRMGVNGCLVGSKIIHDRGTTCWWT